MSDVDNTEPQEPGAGAAPGEGSSSRPTESGPDLEEQLEGVRNDYLRALADMENLRRRHEKQMEDARNYAVERFARDLLPVVDSLEMALGTPVAGEEAVAQLRQGLENTLNLFFQTLGKAGITAVGVEEGRFDPHLHQAIAMVESDGQPNRVLAVHQKGYLIHDRLLRPSMVSVSRPGQGGQASG